MAEKMGRPSKLTPDLQNQIVKLVEVGNYAEVAAVSLGISKTTFYRWMQQGRRAKRGRYREFWEAVTRARAKAESRMVTILSVAAEKDWRAAAHFLERTRPSRYGRKDAVTLRKGEDIDWDKLTNEQVERIAAGEDPEIVLAEEDGDTRLAGAAGRRTA